MSVQIDVKYLPLAALADLVQRSEEDSPNLDGPQAKRRKLDPLDQDSEPQRRKWLIRETSYRIRPVGRALADQVRKHVATLERAAPLDLGEVKLDLPQAPKGRQVPRSAPVTIRSGGQDLFEIGDLDEALVHGLSCHGVTPHAQLWLKNGQARNGSPSVSIDFEIEIQIRLFVNEDFCEVAWPESCYSGRLALLQAAFPPYIDEEEIATRYPEVNLPEEREFPTVELFYAALSSPPRPPFDRKGKKADKPSPALNPAGLLPTLMPFQERSVRWMLGKEGKGVKEDTQNLVDVDGISAELPICWQPVVLGGEGAKSEVGYMNRVTGEFSFDEPQTDTRRSYGGGLLCEEMGLGKTIEILALIMLNQDTSRNNIPAAWDDQLEANVKPSSLTLIIVPSAIVNQWEKEINQRAPSLRVYRYQSIKKLDNKTTAQTLSKAFDVILTTFDVLRQEVNFARVPVQRATRSAQIGKTRYSWRRSLLVEIDFFRVVMDEPQMGANASSIADTCSLIRRCFSWAVSGTPLKSKVADLEGILRFLRIEPVGSSRSAFARLIGPGGLYPFVDMLQRISIRTMKAAVSDELHIPSQSRFLVPLDFGAVEAYAFKQSYERALAENGLSNLDRNGILADWQPDASQMRAWLGRLRQLCCNQAFGAVNEGGLVKLRSLTDVLASMRDGNALALESDERAHADAIVRRGHLTLYDHEMCGNIEASIRLFDRASALLRPIKKRLETELESLRQQIGIRRSLTPLSDDDGESQSDDARREMSRRAGALGNRLRDVLESLHAAIFFRASAFFQLGKFQEQEARDYAEAESLRRQVLSNENGEAAVKMKRLKSYLSKGKKLDIRDLEVAFTKSRPGIKSAKIFDQVETTTDIVNGVAELIWEWREDLLALLLEGLGADDEDNPNGEEFVSNAERQEELDIRLELYQRLVYDWHDRLTGERNAMVDGIGAAAVGQGATQIMGDVILGFTNEPKKPRQKKKGFDIRQFLADLEEDTPSQKLRKKLLITRNELLPHQDDRDQRSWSLRRCITELNTIKLANGDREEEVAIAEEEARRLKMQLGGRDKAFDALTKEMQPIRDAYNAQVSYYAILQDFSDSVEIINVKAKDFAGVQQELQKASDTETRLLYAIRAKATKARYLDTLTEQDHIPASARSCIICQDSTAEKAILTVCGHVFCDDCFMSWYQRAKNCPTCKRALLPKEFDKVSLHATIKKEPGQGDIEGSPSPFPEDVGLDSGLYKLLSEEVKRKILELPIRGDVGTKLDFLARHVRFLRREDPAAKVVVFTAWKIALEILRQAFDRNGIRFVQLEGSQKLKQQAVRSFTEDPDVVAFLLHAESSAAGLNLNAASTIILVEPLLHSSTELQAVGRVHRIGQARETTVFQYCVRNTPDERIAQLAARKGTSLFTRHKRFTSPEADAPINPDCIGETALEDSDDLAFALLAGPERIRLQKHLLAHSSDVIDPNDMVQ